MRSPSESQQEKVREEILEFLKQFCQSRAPVHHPRRTKTAPAEHDRSPKLLNTRSKTYPSYSPRGPPRQDSRGTELPQVEKPQPPLGMSAAKDEPTIRQDVTNVSTSRTTPVSSKTLGETESGIQKDSDDEERVAATYLETWNLNSAMHWYQKAKRKHASQNYGLKSATVDIGIATTWIRLGKFEEAKRTLDEIPEAWNTIDLDIASAIARCRSLCYLGAEDYERAADCLANINDKLQKPHQIEEPFTRLFNQNVIASLMNTLGKHVRAHDLAHKTVSEWTMLLDSLTIKYFQWLQRNFKMQVCLSKSESRHSKGESLHGESESQDDPGKIKKPTSNQKPRHGPETINAAISNLKSRLLSYERVRSNDEVSRIIACWDRKIETATKALFDSRFCLVKIRTEMDLINDASALNEQNLAEMQEFWGPSHVATLKSINFQAKILLRQERVNEAEAACKNALKAMAEQLGPEHYITLELVGTLVKVYLAQTRWTDASELAKNLVLRNERTVGGIHPQTIDSEADRAAILDLLGGTTAAEEIQTRVVQKSNKIFTQAHPISILNESRLAGIYCNAGKWTEARRRIRSVDDTLKTQSTSCINTTLARKVIGVAARRLGCRYRSELETTKDPSRKKILQNDLKGILELSQHHLNQVVELYQSSFCKDYTDTLSTQFEHLLTQRDRQEDIPDEIIDHLHDILGKMSSRLGHVHPQIATMQHELAATYSSIGDWDTAKEFESLALRTRVQLLGESHPDVLRSKLQLYSIQWCLGMISEAADHLRYVHDTVEGSPKEYPSFDILDIKSNLANAYIENKDLARAVQLQEEVVKERERNPSDDSALESRNDLAFIYQQMGKFKDARKQYGEIRKQLKNRDRMLPKHPHPLSLMVQSNMALLQMAEKDFAGADMTLHEILKILKVHEAYGKHCQETITCRYNRALALKKQGLDDKAVKQLKKAVESLEKLVGKDDAESKAIRSTLEQWTTKTPPHTPRAPYSGKRRDSAQLTPGRG